MDRVPVRVEIEYPGDQKCTGHDEQDKSGEEGEQPLPGAPAAGGILFVGEKGTILSGLTGGPELLPASRNARFRPPKKKLSRTIGHYREWIEACKGGKPATCEFGFGAHLTELTLLGNLAVRMGRLLEWDPVEGKVTNEPEANEFIDEPCREGWSL